MTAVERRACRKGLTVKEDAQPTRSPQDSSKTLVSAIDQAGAKAADDLSALARGLDKPVAAVLRGQDKTDLEPIDLADWAQVQQLARQDEPKKADAPYYPWYTERSDKLGMFKELPAPVMILIRRMDRMSRFRVWITQDPEFASIIDTALNNRAKESSRRQLVISIIVAIVSLAAGWLLNAINPLSLLPH